MSEDADSFRAAMADVAPLSPKKQRVATAGGPGREPDIAQLNRREAAVGGGRRAEDPNFLNLGEVPPLAPRDILSWKKNGVQEAVFRRLRAGEYRVQAELDLHGLSVREARQSLFRFYQRALTQRQRTLLIAHGRGEKSATPARLKSYVAHWLGQLPEVIAYHSAPANRGGTGAVLVLLRKFREPAGPEDVRPMPRD